MAFKIKASISNNKNIKQNDINNLIDIRSITKIYDLRRRSNGQYYYCSQATAIVSPGDSIVWKNPEGSSISDDTKQALADIIEPVGQLHVTRTADSASYYFSYENPDCGSNLEIACECIYTGDSSQDDVQDLIDGLNGANYQVERGVCLSLIERRGRKYVEFEMYFGEDDDIMSTRIPWLNCIEGLKQLKTHVQSIEGAAE